MPTCRKSRLPICITCAGINRLSTANKRTALGACIVFLRLNGVDPSADGQEWEGLSTAVEASTIERDEATARLRKLLPTDN